MCIPCKVQRTDNCLVLSSIFCVLLCFSTLCSPGQLAILAMETFFRAKQFLRRLLNSLPTIIFNSFQDSFIIYQRDSYVRRLPRFCALCKYKRPLPLVFRIPRSFCCTSGQTQTSWLPPASPHTVTGFHHPSQVCLCPYIPLRCPLLVFSKVPLYDNLKVLNHYQQGQSYHHLFLAVLSSASE